MKSVDVAVVGGGMVGSAFALMMAQAGRRVLLLEQSAPLPELSLADYGLRVSAINRASERMLTRLGVWAEIVARRASPFTCMHVWDAGGDGHIRFEAAELAEPHLGHIVENQLIQQLLLQALARCSRAEIVYQSQVLSFAASEGQQVLQLGDGSVVSADLLVAADGAHSALRQMAGIECQQRDYQQYGLVCRVKPAVFHQYTAWQRFLPGGPLAFLPLADDSCSIVWSLPEQLAKQMQGLAAADFCEQLAAAFEQRLGAVSLCSERVLFPLRRSHAERYVQAGFALIGDAAHSIHPLAGQGVNLGLLDAAALSQCVLDSSRAMGSLSALRRYERWRRGENQLMLLAMDGFHDLFGRQTAPLPWVRNLGLRFTDACWPLKHRLIRHASGLSGDLPQLACAG